MLKKSITYTDFNDVERTEVFRFNLTKAEMIDMELGGVTNDNPHGFRARLQEVVASNNGRLIMDTFRDIILKAYGEISDDGRKFIKNKRLSEEFENHAAYNVLFIELVTDSTAAAEFIQSIVPAELNDAPTPVKQPQDHQPKTDVQKDAKAADVAKPKLTDEEILSAVRNGTIQVDGRSYLA